MITDDGFRTRGFALLATMLLSACSDTPGKPVAAATVQHPVAENALTTVTLTSDAVRRLGIETVTIDSSNAAATQTAGGEVMLPPEAVQLVTAPVAAVVMAPEGGIPRAGSRLSPRQVILRLAPLPPDRDLARARQDVAAADARFKQADAEARRVAGLFADRLVSARDNERAQAELVSARAEQEAATAKFRLLSGDVNNAAITPLQITSAGGTIRAINVAVGQAVAAGAALAEVIQTDRLWIRVPVYAGDPSRLKLDTAVTVHALGGGPAVQASPVAAPPAGDPLASSVDLYFEVRDARALRPGERVTVDLPMREASVRAITVPLSSVVRDANGGTWVYERLDSLVFERRRVEVQRVSGNAAVLARGLAAGVRIVTAGAAELFGTEFGAGK